jgi:phosphoribosylformylglycinamidine synthase
MEGVPMDRVKVLVLTGYGINCDYETIHAFSMAGAHAKGVHINELVDMQGNSSRERLSDYDVLVFDGGFTWGDDHGAGVILAARLRYNLEDDLQKFVDDGKLVLGICNGFQALVNLGLLPGFDGDYCTRKCALLWNDCGNFRDQWVHLRVASSKSIFTRGMDNIELPVRHAEGKFYADDLTIERLEREDQVVFRYVMPDGAPARGAFPANPNGSLSDIAGICDPTGRIMGLMPHPEGFIHVTQHPAWTRWKEDLAKDGRDIPVEGGGIRVFRNAVESIENLRR